MKQTGVQVRLALSVKLSDVTSLPIACALSPAALRARREGLLSALVRRAVDRQASANGCRLRFEAADDILATIAEAVEAERQCCRFLTFQISVEADGGPISLELSGPPGTAEFLDALLEIS